MTWPESDPAPAGFVKHKYNHETRSRYVYVGICIFLIGLIWLAPLGMILRQALPGRLPQSEIAGSPSALMNAPPPWFMPGSSMGRWPELLGRSLRLSIATAVLAIPAGTLLGLVLSRTSWPLRPLFRDFWNAMIFLPLPIVAASWLGAIGNLGRSQLFGLSDEPLIAGWSAAALIHALAALPLVAWLQGNVMRLTDAHLEEMARLDFPPPRALACTTLRQSLPSAVAAGLILVILTWGDMTVSDLVQERTFAEEAYLQAQMGDGLAAAARTAGPPALLMVLLILAWARWNRRWLRETSADLGRNMAGRPWLEGRSVLRLSIPAVIFTALVWGFPLAGLAWRAGRSGGDVLKNQRPAWSLASLAYNLAEAWPDLAETLPTTLMIATCTAVFAVVSAWVLVSIARTSPLVRILLLFSSAVGLAVPGPVAGLAVAWLWMPWQAIYDNPALIVAAQLFRLLPVAVLILWPAVEYRSRELLELASLDGLTPRERFWRLEWPTIGPVALAAFGAILALAVGELPATNIVAPPGVEMFSVRLWALMHTGMESHLAAVVLLATLLIAAAVMLFKLGLKLIRFR